MRKSPKTQCFRTFSQNLIFCCICWVYLKVSRTWTNKDNDLGLSFECFSALIVYPTKFLILSATFRPSLEHFNFANFELFFAPRAKKNNNFSLSVYQMNSKILLSQLEYVSIKDFAIEQLEKSYDHFCVKIMVAIFTYSRNNLTGL